MKRLPPLTVSAWLRYDAIRSEIDRLRPKRILEIGAGLGAMGARLAVDHAYLGVEPDPSSCEVATRNLATLGRGEIRQGQVEAAGPQQFDLVCAFEVLEHIEDDVGALQSWSQKLTAGGHLLLSVPAHRTKYGPQDKLVGHYRRYDRQDLVDRLLAAGLEPLRWYCCGALIGQLLDAIRNGIARRSAGHARRADATAASGRFLQPRNALGGCATAIAAWPFRWLQKLFYRSDFGVNYVVLARVADRKSAQR